MAGASIFFIVLAITVFVILAVLGIAAMVGMSGAAAVAEDDGTRELEWAATWEGHEIVLRAEGQLGTMYVDGRLIAQGDSLQTTVDGVAVLASLQWRKDAPQARLHVDGQPVLLQRRPFGTPFSVGGPGPAAAGRTPEDPRWEAIVELVDQIRAEGGEAATLAGRAKEELRALLLKIDEAEKAGQAHASLGAETSALDPLIARHEAQATRLIEGLRKLHFGSLETAPAPEEVSRVLAALEVEIAGRERGS
ncbi:MAG: hypothetical protein H6737_29795 [Alphaproteobacteria bacterium]|nr:hypothetical protein [Alphaproteobacteria bacterium]